MASSWQRKEAEGTPAKTITDADYADDIAILANTPNQAETLLHSLERPAAGIGLYINAHKTEYMYFNQTDDISTQEGRCPWCNCYRRRKRTRRHEFKSWTKLIAFHIALIPMGKVWIPLFSLQLWVNSRAD